MPKPNTAPARVFAVVALVGGALVLVVAISSSLGGESGQRPPSARSAGVSTPADRGSVPATYVVQSGDTLTSIAHKTGVPVGRIQALNPKIDPQILVSGEKLRLR